MKDIYDMTFMIDKNIMKLFAYIFSHDIVHSLMFPPHTARLALLEYYPGENITATKLQKSTSNKSASKSCVRTTMYNFIVNNFQLDD